GTFQRLRCSGLANPSADVAGTVHGTVAADDTVALYFRPALLSTSEAVTTSGGCPEEPAAGGPYAGRLDRSALSLSAQFRLGCAGLPFPHSPTFDVVYQVEGTR